MIVIKSIHLISALLVLIVSILSLKNLVKSSSRNKLDNSNKEVIIHKLLTELDLGLDIVKLSLISNFIMISIIIFKQQEFPSFSDFLLGIFIVVAAIESLYYILRHKLANNYILFFKIVTTIILSGIYGYILEFK
ncbi:hypothetical protein [Bacillus cereus]|uniref:hypothetical protein n=1 Tax=Bacillus cereus TaxID=1396 RepID=UPI0011582853|nr:hypothetical protein [Bacillus cereus]